MVNRSTGRVPFVVVYSKPPNFTVDLIHLPHFKSKTAAEIADQVVRTHCDVTQQLEQSNARYKLNADKHHRSKVFSEGDMVMVHLSKNHLPVGVHPKLGARKFGPFRVAAKINDNAYKLDLPPDLSISSTFNIRDLFEYHPPDASPSIIEDSGTNLFSVEGSDAGAS